MPFALGDAKGARSLRRIKELDGLRAILALWVVLVHCGKAVFPEAELPLGNILFDELTRVKVFFMISGMVVTGMLHDKRPAFPTYLANRILRLYPAFLAAILISAVMLPVAEYALTLAPADAASNQSRVKLVDAAQRHFILHFVAHLTMLHGVIPTSLLNRAPYTIIGQAWNISTEFQFYLIAPMLLRLLGLSGKVRMFGIALIAGILVLARYYPNGAFIGRHWEYFAVGGASFVFYRWAAPSIGHSHLYRMLALVAVLMVAIAAATYDWSISLWLGFLLLIAPSQLFGAKINPLRFLAAPLAQTLGTWSYSIYLVHMAALYPMIIVLSMFDMDRTTYFAFLLTGTVLGTLLLSWMLHRFVEVPASTSPRTKRILESAVNFVIIRGARAHRLLLRRSVNYGRIAGLLVVQAESSAT